MLYVPTYSNPTGDTTSQAVAESLGCHEDSGAGFHHLRRRRVRPCTTSTISPPAHPDLLGAAKKAGNPTRVIPVRLDLEDHLRWRRASVSRGSKQTNRVDQRADGHADDHTQQVEQYRHVLFLSRYPGGIAGVMKAHAKLLGAKICGGRGSLVQRARRQGPGALDEAQGRLLRQPRHREVRGEQVVHLAKDAGVALTPAGATYPFGQDPNDRNIRISPTRPPLDQVRKAWKWSRSACSSRPNRDGP